jgi:hypothetical protein
MTAKSGIMRRVARTCAGQSAPAAEHRAAPSVRRDFAARLAAGD